MSERSASTSPWSSKTPVGGLRVAAAAAAQHALVLERGRGDLAVAGRSKTARSASVIARSSRISSGRTSRVRWGSDGSWASRAAAG